MALGHRLVLVLGRVRRCRTRGSAGSGRGAGGAATSTSRIVGLENRFGVAARIDRARQARARAGDPGRRGAGRAGPPEFLRWFDDAGRDAAGLAVPAARGRGTGRRTRSQPGETYVNVGFWGTVPIAPGAADGDVNRAVEAEVTRLGGHKSLYSDAYYDRETFDRLYGVANHRPGQAADRPGHRLTGLYEKAVNRR